MLVGHNPGCESLARTLVAAAGTDPLVIRLHSSEFATAALACIQFDAESFAEITRGPLPVSRRRATPLSRLTPPHAGSGRLLDFKVPTDVRGASL